MSEYMSDQMSENVRNRMTDRIQEHIPENLMPENSCLNIVSHILDTSDTRQENTTGVCGGFQNQLPCGGVGHRSHEATSDGTPAS